MKSALSLYKAELFAAEDCDYSSSKTLGLICPFCKESVFLAKGEKQSPHWRHYKASQSVFCENRALSPEGKKELEKMEIIARNQRLKLFNQRFWNIFAYQKDIPKNLEKLNKKMFGNDLDKMVKHCWDRWEVEKILKILPNIINKKLEPSNLEYQIKQYPLLKNENIVLAEEIIKSFSENKFTTIRYKILSEIIVWLGTKTGLPSFKKLIQLAMIDCLEIFEPPIHSQQIQDMILSSLILTDWEAAIASLDTKGIGFG